MESIDGLSPREQITGALNTLTPREDKVLRLRFGLFDGRPHTLKEIGQEFGRSRERIRQIEAKALRKVGHPSRSKKFKNFFESEEARVSAFRDPCAVRRALERAQQAVTAAEGAEGR